MDPLDNFDPRSPLSEPLETSEPSGQLHTAPILSVLVGPTPTSPHSTPLAFAPTLLPVAPTPGVVSHSTVFRLLATGSAQSVQDYLSRAPAYDDFFLVGVNGPVWVGEVSSVLQAVSTALANDGGKLTAADAFSLLMSTGIIPPASQGKLQAVLPLVLTLIEGGHVSTGQAFFALGAFFMS